MNVVETQKHYCIFRASNTISEGEGVVYTRKAEDGKIYQYMDYKVLKIIAVSIKNMRPYVALETESNILYGYIWPEWIDEDAD